MTKPVPVAFKGVGKKEGLDCFRIENFEVKPWKQPGKFFDGDCYIVLKSTTLPSGKLEHYIHFWIGSQSSQDESGSAAVYSVQLDDLLGGAPIQVREIQGSEGKRFQGYFKQKGGIEYLKGGVKSGFKSATRHKLESRLYRVKGKHFIRVTEMDLSVKSLNSNDVFILDTDQVIYTWIGKSANRQEIYSANNKVDFMRSARHGGACKRVKLREGSQSPVAEAFFKALGHKGPLDEISINSVAEDDVDYARKRPEKGLYRIHKEAGKESECTLIWPDQNKPDEKLRRSMLDKNDSFVLFTEEAVFAWSGSHDTKEEKELAFIQAQNLVKEKNLHIPIYKVCQHMEPEDFTQNFDYWHGDLNINAKTYSQSGGIAKSNPHAPTVYKVREPEKMVVKKAQGGKFSIFKVLTDEDIDSGDFNEAEVTSRRFTLLVDEKGGFGDLFSENCYVMYYEDRAQQAVFYWLGKDASTLSKGFAAAVAKEVDDEKNGKPVQIRQVQGKESDDLLQFFRDDHETTTRLIVHKGKDPRSDNCSSIGDPKSTEMLQIQGYDRRDTRAFEVEFNMASLNSNDCFIIKNGHVRSLWFGMFSTGDERQLCKEICKHLFPKEEPSFIEEGSTGDEKWKKETFGDNQMPYNTTRKPELMCKGAPKLFQLSNASGRYVVEEIKQFAQDDLATEDVMIMVTDHEGYIWQGAESCKEERDKAVEVTEELMKKLSNGSTIYTIKQGEETISFKTHFSSWDANMWDGLVAMFENITIEEDRERDLSPQEFKITFNMSLEDFDNLPGWKRAMLKKEKGYF